MRNFFWVMAMFAGTAGVAMPAQAEGVAFSAGVGTLGVGIDAAYPINDAISIRANVNWGRFDVFDPITSGDTFTGTYLNYVAEMRSAGLIADFYPNGEQGNGFALSAGFYYNGNRFIAQEVALNDIVINGTPYPAGDVGALRAEVEFSSFAPYLGLGYEKDYLAKLSGDSNAAGIIPVNYFMRVGVLFQGAPEATLTSSTGLVDPIDLAVGEFLIEAGFSLVKIYPVISTGITVRF